MGDIFGTGKGRVDNTDESVQEILQAMTAYFPGVMEKIRGQYDPQARAEVDIAKKYSPELNQLSTGLLDTSGREASKIGRELSAAEQLGAAQTEADILKGPGAESVASTLELQKSVDPEFFKNREALMGELDAAFGAMGNDPNALSKGEQEGIARGLGRTSWAAASPMQTLSNAMTFGENQAKRRGEYNNLINLRSGVTNSLRSGIDAGSVATRRTVLPNFGQQNYLGVQTPGVGNANTLGGAFMNNIFATDQNRQQVDAQRNQGSGIGQGIGKIVGAVAAGAGGCWVAREVYGESSPKWLVFREWLYTEAPKWLKWTYLKYGEKFASWLKDKPAWKNVIRHFMDKVVNAK